MTGRFYEITPEIMELANKCSASSIIPSELYTKYNVNRGLRDLNGKGVLVGLTHISDVCSTKLVNGEYIPAEGELYYRGYNVKDLVKGIRNTRAEMDVPPSRKAKVFIVTEDKELEEIFASMKTAYAALISASEIKVQDTKDGIGEDAVSVVIPGAVVYIPLEDLVDFEKEKERLKKEQERLKKELARSKGMLSNEKFLSKAPEAKVLEEKEKLAKYEQMMQQVEERLSQMK